LVSSVTIYIAPPWPPFTMISDDDLYRLAIFLGSCAMLMIVLYHFLDVNASEEEPESVESANQIKASGAVPAVSTDKVSASRKGN
jgi:oligosaccharyl transferase complex subunit OST4